ncbi:MAG: lytic transglycosylase domain-containing protein [Magnetococcales bacterium]|nr:lytic transglycosylase domain-containing protein [Magnetococcales bacterium]
MLFLRVAVVWLGVISPALAQEDLVREYRRWFEMLEREGSLEALQDRSKWPGHELLNSYLELELLLHPNYQMTNERLEGFLNRWPQHAQADRLVRIMEKRIVELDGEVAERWYARHPPKSQLARLQHVGGLLRKERINEAFVLWRDLYREGAAVVLPAIDERHSFWTRLVSGDHETRARSLLGRGPGSSFGNLLRLMPAERRDFFLALDAARKGEQNFSALAKKAKLTPAETQELWRERFEYLHRAGAREKLLEMLQGAEGKLLAPEDRQRWRYHYGRAMVFINHDYKAAYRLLQENVRDKGGALEDSVWLAGWSALNGGDLNRAEMLFQQLAKEGLTTGGRSQGAYWAARLNHSAEQKQFWLHMAARNLDNIYGLLAKEEVSGFLTTLKSDELATCPDDNGKLSPEEAKGLRLLQEVGRDWYNGGEIQKLGDRLNLLPEERLCLAIRYGAAELALKLSHEVQKKDRVVWRGLFPVPNWVPDGGWTLAQAVIWGTSRQESQFFPRAESSAKALGVMQLMPDTAAMEARLSQFPPSNRFRLQLPGYNLALGQAYMQRMLKQFDGDLVLALCAYNAGPGRAKAWQEKRRSEDALTFIENIPITETRTYVKRVMAGVGVYRMLLDGGVSMKAYLAPGGPGLAALRPGQGARPEP